MAYSIPSDMETAACSAPLQEYGQKRLRDTEFVLPVCIGTVAWSLGKKVRRPSGAHRGLAAIANFKEQLL